LLGRYDSGGIIAPGPLICMSPGHPRIGLNVLKYYRIVARIIVPVLQVRCASCRGLYGSTGWYAGGAAPRRVWYCIAMRYGRGAYGV
jgi:hypothetical protein